MANSVKILSLQVEAFKRIQAISIKPTADGLTVIGGKNGHGKTSVIDAIMWALGGDKYKPNAANHQVPDDGELQRKMDITLELSNGIIVQRKGDKGSLKVTDANEMSGNQSLLNRFIENLALDLPKFIDATPKKKADTLLQIIGVGDHLHQLEDKIVDTFNDRKVANKLLKESKIIFEKAYDPDEKVEEKLEVSELVEELDKILEAKKEVQFLVYKADEIKHNSEGMIIDNEADLEEIKILNKRVGNRIHALDQNELKALTIKEKIKKIIIHDEKPVRKKIEDSSAINEEIAKQIKAIEEYKIIKATLAQREKNQKSLDDDISLLRVDRMRLLKGVDMPLEGLSIEDDELIFNGFKWDGMSSSDQLKVATAIVKKLNPKCGFVLLDKLEQFDLDTLNEFGDWAKNEGLQIIATRVSTGSECSIIIEDGNII